MAAIDVCEKAIQGEMDIWDYVKAYTFSNFVCF